VYGPVCTVVWEGWGREASPYPDPKGTPPEAAEAAARCASW
jgi:hypothetical protein